MMQSHSSINSEDKTETKIFKNMSSNYTGIHFISYFRIDVHQKINNLYEEYPCL